MVSSAPTIPGFNYSSITTKDATDGTFSVDFKCFEDAVINVTFNIVVPTYDPVLVTS
jgi:hypothetical protein